MPVTAFASNLGEFFPTSGTITLGNSRQGLDDEQLASFGGRKP